MDGISYRLRIRPRYAESHPENRAVCSEFGDSFEYHGMPLPWYVGAPTSGPSDAATFLWPDTRR